MNQGIHDISIEQYHGGPGISRSGIMEFKKSPLHYWHKYLNPERAPTESTEAMAFGSALHTYILEPQTFEDRYHVWQKVNGRKPASNTNGWAEIVTAANGKLLICEEDLKPITDMHRAINQHPTARNMLEGGVNEKSLYWADKDTGILCKVRPDVLHANLVIDLKTSSDASFRTFQRDAFAFGYHIQCGMIAEALWALKGINMMNFVFVVVEKTEPYATVVYKLDENAVNKGREEFKKILFDIKECQASDSWTAYADATIDLPAYAYSNQGEI